MRRSISSITRRAVWVAALVSCSSGTEVSPPPPPPPPPPPDLVRNLGIQGGNNQEGFVGQPVAVSPGVRVTNSSGAGVPNVSVTFAVASGGGTVAGANQTTDANGVATVGSWQLGPAPGPNTLTASVTGANGSPLTFTATGKEVVLEPSRDSAIGGTINAKRVRIPAGITLTVTSALVLTVEESAEIAGTLRGPCTGMTIDAQGDLVIKGAIDNACAGPAENPAPLQLNGRGGYAIDGGTITTDGDFEITNDPTLTDADVPAAPGLAPAAAAASARPPGVCRLAAGRITAGSRARDGAAGSPNGGNGLDGRRLWVTCRGNATVSGMTIHAQDGGHGGKGTDARVPLAMANGGDGGDGGEIRFLGTGSIDFDGTNDVETGGGGDGGAADGIPPQSPIGSKAPSGKAVGGRGASPGLFTMRALGPISFPVPPLGAQTIRIGRSGNGGTATGIGADGMNAGAQAAQQGGDGEAKGGNGGDTPAAQLRGANVTGVLKLDVVENAGHGGNAGATGGKGGDGNQQFKDGARGGDFSGDGGKGGDALLMDLGGNRLGLAGVGGSASLERGRGGNGYSDCRKPLEPGGNGGRGGNGTGTGGDGGAGLLGGIDGQTLVRDEAGNGGNGGDGAGPGTGGGKGTDNVSPRVRTDTPPVFQAGLPGKGCVFNTTWVVKSDPLNHNAVLNLTAGTHPVRLTKLGTSIGVELLDFRAGAGGGPLNPNGTFTASGTFQIQTSLGLRQGAFVMSGTIDVANGTFTADVALVGLPGGPVTYTVTGGVP
jgi:hypothetical protein